PRTVTLYEPARPARQQEHQRDEWQQRGASLGRRVALYLNQIQRKEEQNTAQSGVEKKREQVGSAEAARMKQPQRQHWCLRPALEDEKGDQQKDARNASGRH